MVDCAEAGDYAGGEQEVWFRLDSQGVHLLVVCLSHPRSSSSSGSALCGPAR